MKRPEIVERISDTMHHIAPTAHVILYGSEARGDARADSDIDLLVLLEDSEQPFIERELEIVRQLYKVELDTGVIISPHIVLRRQWEKHVTLFRLNIQREGVTL